MARLIGLTADQIISVDTSAANEHMVERKYGWAPVGFTPYK